MAQAAGNNPIGRLIAKMAIGFVRRSAETPIDLQVEQLRLRCFLWDNYTERKFVFMPWRFDVRERKYLFASLPADGVVVDIGANVGVYTLLAANHMRSGARVLAIEPYAPIFARLCFNISATEQSRERWPQITPLQLGVADEEGEFDLHIHPGNLGENSLVPAGGGQGQHERIKCLPLSRILNDHDIKRMDLLKIDIEGAEDIALIPFLRDAPESQLPRCVLLENSADRWRLDLVGWLHKRGYSAALRTRMNTVYEITHR